jgi:hypothetical protein
MLIVIPRLGLNIKLNPNKTVQRIDYYFKELTYTEKILTIDNIYEIIARKSFKAYFFFPTVKSEINYVMYRLLSTKFDERKYVFVDGKITRKIIKRKLKLIQNRQMKEPEEVFDFDDIMNLVLHKYDFLILYKWLKISVDKTGIIKDSNLKEYKGMKIEDLDLDFSDDNFKVEFKVYNRGSFVIYSRFFDKKLLKDCLEKIKTKYFRNFEYIQKCNSYIVLKKEDKIEKKKLIKFL